MECNYTKYRYINISFKQFKSVLKFYLHYNKVLWNIINKKSHTLYSNLDYFYLFLKTIILLSHQFHCIIISIVTRCTITVNSFSPENIIRFNFFLLLFAFQFMFILIMVSHLEIAEFPDSIRRSSPEI